MNTYEESQINNATMLMEEVQNKCKLMNDIFMWHCGSVYSTVMCTLDCESRITLPCLFFSMHKNKETMTYEQINVIS